MDILSSLLVVAFAGLIHASFQLSTSVLTTLGGHAFSARKSHARIVGLTSSFVFGAGLMTVLLVSCAAFIIASAFGTTIPLYAWSIASGVLFGVGVAVWLFYYRKGEGTRLWIPRSLALYLSDRTKVTKISGEAFGLGLVSVLSEIIFIVGPIVIGALVLVQLPAQWQLLGVLIYTVISLLSLIIVWALIGSGHTLTGVQKWREQNKGFLQFAAGSGLLVLGFFIFVQEVVTASVGGI